MLELEVPPGLIYISYDSCEVVLEEMSEFVVFPLWKSLWGTTGLENNPPHKESDLKPVPTIQFLSKLSSDVIIKCTPQSIKGFVKKKCHRLVLQGMP